MAIASADAEPMMTALSKRMLQALLIFLVIAIVLSLLALLQNKVPLNESPGIAARLAVYLGQNYAETSDQASLPELKTRQFKQAATDLMNRLPDIMNELGWKVVSVDNHAMKIHAIVTTRWLRFKDDIHIRLDPKDHEHTSLYIHSRSRIGRADYGANLGHILKLYKRIDEKIPSP